MQETPHVQPPQDGDSRRGVMSRLSSLAMFTGLAAGYGMFVHVCGRFLYPAREPGKNWIFVARVGDLKVGQSLVFKTPTGASISVARSGTGTTTADFVALSSICPHLGCQVHWEGNKDRFFCPCHNGSFDKSGKALSGPPAEAGQSLSRYPLDVRQGMLFIELPETLTASLEDCTVEEPGGSPGPGHDPCLFQSPKEF